MSWGETLCLAAGHRVCDRHADAGDPGVQRARCRTCGHALIRSGITRRWIISGYLG